ncbi:MAG: hypothetical protein SchgKO_08930 [Schleiferiaceae bacterium]
MVSGEKEYVLKKKEAYLPVMRKNQLLKSAFLLFTILFGYLGTQAQSNLDSALIQELSELGAVDQIAARNAFPPEEYKGLSQEDWNGVKDSIYRHNQKVAEAIFREVGFPGFDKVGVKGSADFWSLVQHSDFDPEFQEEILIAMKVEVKNQNANSRLFAMLTDRVKKNTGQKQVYGTQVDYDLFTGKAYPLETDDPENLNARRAEVGLEPIEVYLEDMTQTNMAMMPMILGLTIPSFLLVVVGLAIVVFVVVRRRKAKRA